MARIESVITDVFIEFNTEVDYEEDVDPKPYCSLIESNVHQRHMLTGLQ